MGKKPTKFSKIEGWEYSFPSLLPLLINTHIYISLNHASISYASTKCRGTWLSAGTKIWTACGPRGACSLMKRNVWKWVLQCEQTRAPAEAHAGAGSGRRPEYLPGTGGELPEQNLLCELASWGWHQCDWQEDAVGHRQRTQVPQMKHTCVLMGHTWVVAGLSVRGHASLILRFFMETRARQNLLAFPESRTGLFSFLLSFFHLSIVDLQCFIDFCCISKWLSYIYLVFHISALWFIIGYWIWFSVLSSRTALFIHFYI